MEKPALSILFFYRWASFLLARAEPFKHEMSMEKARSLFESGESVTALVLDDNQLHAKIEMNKAYFGVNFFDAAAREYMTYEFRPRDGKLFLENVVFFEFDGDSMKAARREDIGFDPSGMTSTLVRDFAAGEQLKSTPRQVDVSGNWEAYPEFGNYESLLRLERS
jgi:hypothetical protein